MAHTQMAESPRDRLRAEILAITDRGQALSREIGEAVLGNRQLEELRRERREVREGLEDLHAALAIARDDSHKRKDDGN